MQKISIVYVIGGVVMQRYGLVWIDCSEKVMFYGVL